MSPLAAALLTIALSLVVQVFIGVTDAIRPGAQTDIVNLAACDILATSLVIFAMVRVHARESSLRVTMGFAPIAPLHALLSLAIGAGLYPLLSTVDDLVLRRWPMTDADTLDNLEKVVSHSSHFTLVLAAFVVMPCARELFFRGIVYDEVKRTSGVRVALIATSVFYACSLLEWRAMPTAVLLGAVLAWLRERAGTVVAPLLAQIAFGAVVGVPILLGRAPFADGARFPRSG